MSGIVGFGDAGGGELGLAAACPGGANGTPGVGMIGAGAGIADAGSGGGPAIPPRLDGRRLAGPTLAGATLGGGTLAGPELSLTGAAPVCDPGVKPFGRGGAGIGGSGAIGLRGAMPETPRAAFGSPDDGAAVDAGPLEGGPADGGIPGAGIPDVGIPDAGTCGASGATGDDGV